MHPNLTKLLGFRFKIIYLIKGEESLTGIFKNGAQNFPTVFFKKKKFLKNFFEHHLTFYQLFILFELHHEVQKVLRRCSKYHQLLHKSPKRSTWYCKKLQRKRPERPDNPRCDQKMDWWTTCWIQLKIGTKTDCSHQTNAPKNKKPIYQRSINQQPNCGQRSEDW